MDGDTQAAPEAAAGLAGGTAGITLEMVRETFAEWRVFERDGRWWAMRGGTVAGDGPRSLVRAFVFAMTLIGLAEQLSLQEWLRRMTEEELESVWREGLAAVAP